MNKEATSPRQRMQELLAIPDRQRTDEEWDELIELEISLAPGNRGTPGTGPMPEANPHRRHGGGGGQPQHRQNAGGVPGQGQGKRQGKKFHRKPRGGGGGGGNGGGGQPR